MKAGEQCLGFRAGALALVTVVASCSAEAPTGTAAQEVITAPLPSTLNLILHAKTTVTIGPFTQVQGDVGSSGVNGSVLFDVDAGQGFSFDASFVLANKVTVRDGASVRNVIGNDITVDGFASTQTLGFDPAAMPAMPALTTATPGTTNVSLAANQARQLCPGQYGAISLAAGSTLAMNGGVYQVSRLVLAEGAKLEPSEPVVILVTGNVTIANTAMVRPHPQLVNPMTAKHIRIEVGGRITIGDRVQLRAHVLAPNANLTIGEAVSFTGAAWAKSIGVGASGNIRGEDAVAAQAPLVPPPCNDNSACTVDACVTSGAVAFCRNTPVAAGTSCADGNTCNGDETCNAAGGCLAGAPPAAGTSCADGDLCNGDETCDGFASCLVGTPPVVNDRNACTTDACDPAAGVSHAPLPDGTTCTGGGTCEAGVCSFEGALFSERFFEFETAPAQCGKWNDFLANQLSSVSYGSVTVSGSRDPSGVTCSDPAAATRICQALHTGSFASLSCGGHVWNVGSCGGTELSVDTSVCFCSFNVRTVRPCTGFQWGGIFDDTCGAQSQDLTVICE